MSESLTFPRHLMTFVDTCKLQDLTVYQKWRENSDGQMSTGSCHLLLWLQHWGKVHCGTVSRWSLRLCHGSESGRSGSSCLWLPRHKLDTVWWLGVKAPENSFQSLDVFVFELTKHQSEYLNPDWSSDEQDTTFSKNTQRPPLIWPKITKLWQNYIVYAVYFSHAHE